MAETLKNMAKQEHFQGLKAIITSSICNLTQFNPRKSYLSFQKLGVEKIWE